MNDNDDQFMEISGVWDVHTLSWPPELPWHIRPRACAAGGHRRTCILSTSGRFGGKSPAPGGSARWIHPAGSGGVVDTGGSLGLAIPNPVSPERHRLDENVTPT